MGPYTPHSRRTDPLANGVVVINELVDALHVPAAHVALLPDECVPFPLAHYCRSLCLCRPLGVEHLCHLRLHPAYLRALCTAPSPHCHDADAGDSIVTDAADHGMPATKMTSTVDVNVIGAGGGMRV